MSRAFELPDLGEGIHEGEVLAVMVAVGDEVKEGDPILEVETDKAAVEIPSPYTGKVAEVLVQPGDTVKVGQVLITFMGEGAAEAPVLKKSEEREAPREAEKQAPVAERKGGPVPASPATRRLARELGVDLKQVPSTGPGGLVTAEDVRGFKERGAEVQTIAPSPEPVPVERKPATADTYQFPDFSKWGPVERVPVRSIRKATARQMDISWSRIPHVHNLDDIDMTKLEAFRRRHKADVEAKGGKLTITVFALKAVATALKAYPNFNATYDTNADEIVIKHYFHIGVAVNTDDGLIVPVLRDVDRKSITELALEMTELAQKTRARKTSLEEMQGGTFTITNVGPMGGGYFAPIINFPQVSILGMGAASMKPVVREKEGGGHEIVPRLMMPIVLCIDHRVLDGADSLKFIKVVKDALEDPDELLMTMI
ncbi:dihydrolipoamide acetyltransferase family protein [Thermodesulfobacteriota bacterium]